MAKSLSFDLLPRVVIQDAYLMVGEIRLNSFHQTCEVDVYVFESEGARHQRLADHEVDLHRPLKIITVRPPFDRYQEFLETPAKDLVAAIYQLLHEVPESAAVNPHGLARLLSQGEDV